MEENANMKATGIVRRIDDLGRVVVPKEIRRTLRLREGDPIEIFTNREGEIILKKYSHVGEMGDFVKSYAEAVAQTLGHIVMISDMDQIVAVSGTSKKDWLSKPISREVESTIHNRETLVASKEEQKFVPISEEIADVSSEVIVPIVSEGDTVGAVLILSKETKAKLGETETKVATAAASFLGKQMEG